MGRGARHILLGGLSAAVCGIFAVTGPIATAWDRVSILTAYLCLILLCVGLSIGPWRALATGRPTLNSYLRRDVGIWAALTGLVHLVLATELSMNSSYVGAVVDAAEQPPGRQLFAWASVSGYLVGLNFLLLLALSNDHVMRSLGSVWWKRLQRTSYLGFCLTLLHGLAFQVLESRTWALVAVLVLAGAVVVVFQWRSALAVRKRLLVASTNR